MNPSAGDYYNKIAHLYDLMYNQDTGINHAVHVAWVDEWREQYQLPKQVLDLACGTGKHLACFQALGYTCRGVDASAAMLDVARTNAPDVSCEVGEFHNFTLPEQVSLTTSFFNAMSYNTSADAIRAAFRHVKRHLTAQGLFIFDMRCGSDPTPAFDVKSFHHDPYWVSRTVVGVPTAAGYQTTMYVVVFDGETSKALTAATLRGIYAEADVTTMLVDCGYQVLYCGEGYTRSPLTVFVAQA